MEGQEELKRDPRRNLMLGLPKAYLDEGTQFLNLNKDSANHKQEFSCLHRPF